MTLGRRALRARVLRHVPGAGGQADRDAGVPVLPDAPRILVVRPDHLGDVLFVGPALARLRALLPQADVTLLVGPWSEPIAARMPHADRVETLVFPWFDRRPKGAPWRPYVRLARAARWLKTTVPADVLLVMRDDDYWSAWMGALAGVPVRVGHDHALVRPFLTRTCRAWEGAEHSVEANDAVIRALSSAPMDAVNALSDPVRVRITHDDAARAARLLDPILGDAPSVGPIAVHPGAGAPVKRWRPAAWAEVLDALTAPGETVVLTGSPDEGDLTAAIAARLDRPVIDLAGRTDLGALAAVFARCRLVMGPDSGPLHLAVAVGTRTVHLFGPADAGRFGPWGPGARHRVVATRLPCAPCGRLAWPVVEDHPCVRTIEVADVCLAASSCWG